MQRRAAAAAVVAPAPVVQCLDDPYALHLAGARGDVGSIAAGGLTGPSTSLPHLDRIQASFGAHDVSGVRAHQGEAAARASDQIGATAYATGNQVAFASAPDLHTAAHEAAHVVQQRAGVHLKGGVGEEGDPYEQHADAVADRVVRGESAESLLDAYAHPGAAAASGGPVQRYSKKGPVRVSDNKDMVVVTNGPHHEAFVSKGILDNGKNGLQDESHVELSAGGDMDARDVGLQDDEVNTGLVEVTAKMKKSDIETRQREGALDVSSDYSKRAQKVMDKLVKPGFFSFKKNIDISDVDVERDILGDQEVKKAISATYLTIANPQTKEDKEKKHDFSPERVADVAKKNGVPLKIIYFLVNQIREYHQRVLSEYGEGGFTTPNDCGEVAKNFVRGEEIKADLSGGEGFPYHFFSMVFKDGSDRISLENAVGGNHLEQLWKQGKFDADWKWEMRGANNTDHEGDKNIDHGLGEDKTAPSKNMRDMQYGLRLDGQDKLRPKDDKKKH